MSEPKAGALVQRLDVGAMIQTALEKDTGVETMERLFALAKDMRAEQAKAAWHQAMASFQAEAPPPKKSKTATVTMKSGGKYQYSYAPLDDLIATMRPVLAKHGLSVVFKTKADSKIVSARADVVHIEGHVESCEFAVPIDLTSYMNPAQQVGSALTYARRYAYLAALGLSPEDDDDAGGASEGKEPPPVKQRDPAPPPAPQSQSPDGPPVWRGKLESVEIKTGTHNNKDKTPWTAWVYKGDDGQKFGTFSSTVAEALDKFITDKLFIEIVFSENKNGKKIEEYRDVTSEEMPL